MNEKSYRLRAVKQEGANVNTCGLGLSLFEASNCGKKKLSSVCFGLVKNKASPQTYINLPGTASCPIQTMACYYV